MRPQGPGTITHRSEIIWLDVDDTFEATRKRTENEIHSVYRVANKELDKLEGLVHIKDPFLKDMASSNFESKKLKQ